ncbi:hypothetical protein HW932_18680 [Allochromatium humboldtianum]|uniref:Uncharacterized protein n=1 Tax=Allochromatium humboldtianum TaxID=504901 RepID=A0A850RK75_9GAMM|nr:hypothetical protein [Allochromatium humboldtianum]NVZ11280.1 hypothetical protein [Allochromatium humboldtianum]
MPQRLLQDDAGDLGEPGGVGMLFESVQLPGEVFVIEPLAVLIEGVGALDKQPIRLFIRTSSRRESCSFYKQPIRLFTTNFSAKIDYFSSVFSNSPVLTFFSAPREHIEKTRS